jgi:serine/threonine protein kinase
MKRPRFSAYDRKAAEKTKRHFNREGRTWSLLNHPNILPFCGLVQIMNEMYLVSPWIAYGDLLGFATARMDYLLLLPTERCKHPCHAIYSRYREFDMVLGIASGLAYLHSWNVLHGDVKALNVLLDGDLNPLLCDFGMTKILDWDYTASSSAFLNAAGSWRWLAPELIKDNSRRKGIESDLYAFSMTITEILTGQMPFPSVNFLNLGSLVMGGVRPLPEPRQRDNQDFNLLWKVAAACWAENPMERPSADAVVAFLTSAART